MFNGPELQFGKIKSPGENEGMLHSSVELNATEQDTTKSLEWQVLYFVYFTTIRKEQTHKTNTYNNKKNPEEVLSEIRG